MARFWQRVRRQSLAVWLAAALMVVSLVMLGRATILHFDGIQTWIDGLGMWGMVAYIGLFVLLTSLFVPDTLLAIIAGAVYGLGWGLLLVAVGGLLGACIQWTLARFLLREHIDAAVRGWPTLHAIQRAVLKQQLRLQVLLRLTPLNPALVSYVLGAAGVRLAGFFVACLALIPLFVLEVYAGYAGRALAGDDPNGWLNDLALIVGLVACVIVAVMVTRTARRAVREAVRDGTVPRSPGNEVGGV
jgi:uncharacterized membrane protein YdjX (TVP38/TMEM64 family)